MFSACCHNHILFEFSLWLCSGQEAVYELWQCSEGKQCAWMWRWWSAHSSIQTSPSTASAEGHRGQQREERCRRIGGRWDAHTKASMWKTAAESLESVWGSCCTLSVLSISADHYKKNKTKLMEVNREIASLIYFSGYNFSFIICLIFHYSAYCYVEQ